ncbi:MAG: MEDS domain-containing protein [Gammaproteobacteria bacterium]
MPSTNDSFHSTTQNVAEAGQLIRLAGSALEKHYHICAFFNSKEEEYPVLLPFIKEGLERGEKAFHVVDPNFLNEHLRYLESAGIETQAVRHSGQLELRNWYQAYLIDGHFDQNRMLAMLQNVLDEARQEGFPLTRLIAHMEWAMEDRPGVNDIVEYETRLNYFLHAYPDPVICVYDLDRFGAGVIDILRTHPMVIIGGVLQENPFFMPPDDFLGELRNRQNRKIHSVAS